MSPTIAKIAKTNTGKDVMIHGIRHPSRGIPGCILQTSVTKKGLTTE